MEWGLKIEMKFVEKIKLNVLYSQVCGLSHPVACGGFSKIAEVLCAVHGYLHNELITNLRIRANSLEQWPYSEEELVSREDNNSWNSLPGSLRWSLQEY